MIWVLLQADSSQWSLVTQQVQHVFGFLPWMRTPLLAQCVDLVVRLYYAAVHNLVIRVWECSKEHSWKQQHPTDTLCLTCAAFCRYVHPASRRSTMLPRSNDWIATTDTRSIAGWKSEPLWPFAWENTLPQEEATLYVDETVWAPLTVTCVSFGLNLLSYTPAIINYLLHQFCNTKYIFEGVAFFR